MSDLIERQAAIDVCMKYNGQGYVWSCIMGDIRNLPSAQPERKKGRWIGYNTDKEGWNRTDGSPVFMSCSECGGTVLNNGSAHWNFCPNCGAEMEGGCDVETEV